MLQHARRQRLSTFARWSFAAAACACLMPFQLVARATVAGPAQSIDSSSVQAAAPALRVQAPGQSAVQVPAPPAPPESPAARPVVPAPPAPPASPAARPVVPAPPASPAARPVVPAPPAPPAQPQASEPPAPPLVSGGYREQLEEARAALERIEKEQALETLQSEAGRRAIAERLVSDLGRLQEVVSRAERAAARAAGSGAGPARRGGEAARGPADAGGATGAGQADAGAVARGPAAASAGTRAAGGAARGRHEEVAPRPRSSGPSGSPDERCSGGTRASPGRPRCSAS